MTPNRRTLGTGGSAEVHRALDTVENINVVRAAAATARMRAPEGTLPSKPDDMTFALFRPAV